MYKVGDEVYVKAHVVGTDAKPFDGYGYKVQFLDSVNKEWDWVSDKTISDKTYEQGLADAWELAKKFRVRQSDGGLSNSELLEIFGTTYIDMIFKNHTYEEALAKIEAYEREKEITVGDVVYGDDDPESFGVVTRKDSFGFYVMWDDGSSGRDKKPESLHKTDKHIDIEGLLKQIGE